MKRIVIVGAGFLGLRVARLVAKRAGKQTSVFLIDPKDNFVFTPWLIDLLAGDVTREEICRELEPIAERDGFEFIKGRVLSVDRKKCNITVRNKSRKSTLGYDVLVMCQGTRTNFYGIPGAEQNCLPLKVEKDVTHIKTSLKTLLKHGGGSVCVVGGGPSGVESIFAIKQFIARLREHEPRCAKTPFEVFMLQAAPQILPGCSESIVKKVQHEFKKNKIKCLSGDPVTEVRDHTLITASGKHLRADLVIWTAGVEANPIELTPKPEVDHGYYVVDNYFHINTDVFAAGDIARFKIKGAPVPKTAQTALQMSEILTRNILALLKNKRLRPFKAKSRGVIITLGETAVGSFLHVFTFKSRLWLRLRKLFYSHRFRQTTGT